MLPSLVAPASSLLFGVSVSSSCVRALAAAATPSSSAALKQSFGAMAAPTCSQPAASSPAACAGLERTEQPTHRSTPASALLTGTTHSSATASPEPMASGISAAITDTWLLHPSSAPLPILGSSIRSSSIASTSTNTSSSSGILTTVSLRQPLSAATHQPGQSVLSIPRLPFAPAPSKSYLPGSRTKSLVEPSAAGAVGHPTSSRRALFNILSSKPPDSKKWQQRRLVGWTPEQFYLVVSDVEQYHHFVPWCQKSQVIKRISDKSMEAELEVGFQVLVERYTSMVTFERPRLVRSCVNNSLLFHHLNSDWILDPGPAPRTCWLNFKVDFAFNSVMYSNLADLFFSQVVKEMVSAFEGRCAKLYGPSSLLNLHHQPGKASKGVGSTH